MWVSPRRRAGRRRGFPLCPETFSLRCVPQEVWSREQAGMNDAFLANAGSYALSRARYLDMHQALAETAAYEVGG